MLIVVQFPFADARSFVSPPTNRLSTPAWPFAVPGKDFVRSFGGLEKRKRGGIEAWTAEDIYCRATRPLRFYPPLGKTSFETASASLELKCAFRRLLYDGEVVLRLEYGFRIDEKKRDKFSVVIDGQSLLDLVTYCLSRPVKISSCNKDGVTDSCDFIQCSKKIAQRYLEATTCRSHSGLPFEPDSWWVTPVAPLVLIEYLACEVTSLPRYARPVPAITEQIDTNTFLWYCPLKYMGQQLGFWCLRYGYGANRDVLRRLRIHLLRLHAERECLKQILRYVATSRIYIGAPNRESDFMQLYLKNSIRLLNRKSRYGLPQSHILEVAQNADDYITEGERANLLSAIESIRRNLFHSIRRFTAREGKGETAFYNISSSGPVNIGRTIHTGEEHVTEYNIKFGNRAVLHGDFVVANTIQNSLNKIDSSKATAELKEQLKSLHQQVTEMTKHMDPAKAKEAARDLQTFTDEVTSEAPREKWYSVSAEGLLDAAKSVGNIAVPVITTVKAILSLLSTNS